MMFKASDSKIYSEEQLEEQRFLCGDALYAQEYECDFYAVIKGTFYGKQLDAVREAGGIGHYPWDPKYPVVTAWDLGINDKTAIWFAQEIDGFVFVIDYLEDSDQGLPYYIHMVNTKPYQYTYHILPHDVKQRNFSTGHTRLSELMASGLRCVVAPKLPVFDGINAVRSLLSKCRFNANNCQLGLDALFHYKSQPNDRLGVMNTQPVHDWSSHAADAFRYLAIGFRSSMGKEGLLDYFKNPDTAHARKYDDYNPLLHTEEISE